MKEKKNNDLLIFLTIFEYIFLGLMLISTVVLFDYTFSKLFCGFLDSYLDGVFYRILDCFGLYYTTFEQWEYDMILIRNFDIIGRFSFSFWLLINIFKFILIGDKCDVIFDIMFLILVIIGISYISFISEYWIGLLFLLVPVLYSYKIN